MERNFVYHTDDRRFFRDGAPGDGIALANENYSAGVPEDVYPRGSNVLNHNTIMNNIVMGGHYALYFFAYQGVYASSTPPPNGMKNTLIANNTFYGGSGAVVAFEDHPANSNNTVVNNIYYQAAGQPLAYITAEHGFSFHHNLWHGNDLGALPAIAVGIGTVTGSEPFLRNAAGTSSDDYKLTRGSRAVGAGACIREVEVDFWGARRSSNGCSIGAHEPRS
jgi:hypothetical protein